MFKRWEGSRLEMGEHFKCWLLFDCFFFFVLCVLCNVIFGSHILIMHMQSFFSISPFNISYEFSVTFQLMGYHINLPV